MLRRKKNESKRSTQTATAKVTIVEMATKMCGKTGTLSMLTWTVRFFLARALTNHICLKEVASATRHHRLDSRPWCGRCRVPFLVTGLFAAKLSEKRQVALHSGWLVAIPPGIHVNLDRGFRNLQRHYKKYVFTMPIMLF